MNNSSRSMRLPASKMFGPEFVYMSNIGEKSIDRRVLYQFRKLTEDEVVWVTEMERGFWSRGPLAECKFGDSFGRTQYI